MQNKYDMAMTVKKYHQGEPILERFTKKDKVSPE